MQNKLDKSLCFEDYVCTLTDKNGYAFFVIKAKERAYPEAPSGIYIINSGDAVYRVKNMMSWLAPGKLSIKQVNYKMKDLRIFSASGKSDVEESKKLYSESKLYVGKDTHDGEFLLRVQYFYYYDPDQIDSVMKMIKVIDKEISTRTIYTYDDEYQSRINNLHKYREIK